jgi:glycerol transport system ATP-binding protein
MPRRRASNNNNQRRTALQLSLERVTKRVGAQTWLYEQSIAPASGAVTVLLGATQAGKTSLMRLMAGLDTPTTGKVMVNGEDVTGVPVRDRNVAMVYQQFINYPSLTVAENIGSPLKLRGEARVNERVAALAEKLHIAQFLQRYPSELSGGQQQRVALARALAKNAPLMLLDEPLVNLDYKLREELREELTQLFASGDSTVIYATTEPGEALLLGGHTAVLDGGELLQYGPTAEVFHKPKSLRVARAFSDPPMNLLRGHASSAGVQLAGGLALPLAMPPGLQGEVTVGLRAGALKLGRADDAGVQVPSRVVLAEIAGSDTFVHLHSPAGELVAQLTGVHRFDLGSSFTLRFDTASAYVFDADGNLALSPRNGKG